MKWTEPILCLRRYRRNTITMPPRCLYTSPILDTFLLIHDLIINTNTKDSWRCKGRKTGIPLPTEELMNGNIYSTRRSTSHFKAQKTTSLSALDSHKEPLTVLTDVRLKRHCVKCGGDVTHGQLSCSIQPPTLKRPQPSCYCVCTRVQILILNTAIS